VNAVRPYVAIEEASSFRNEEQYILSNGSSPGVAAPGRCAPGRTSAAFSASLILDLRDVDASMATVDQSANSRSLRRYTAS
jgi:hypothetical protein